MEPHNSRDVHVFGIKCNAILRGLSVIVPIYMTILSLKEHRSCADGRARASTRHLHGITERAARCDTVKVPAESAGAVAR